MQPERSLPDPTAVAAALPARRRAAVLRLGAAMLAAAWPLAVSAQAPDVDPSRYPQRPIRLVVPYPPGAANDTLARMLAQHLALGLGQSVVVDNRPGAGGHLGAEQVARAPGDGFTLLIGTSGLIAAGPHLYKQLGYDARRDLTPLVRFANVPYVLAVPASTGWRGVQDLVAQAKTRPGGLNFASSGNGSVPHLCGELFNLKAGVKLVHIPYKGGAPAMNDVVAGQVHLYCGGIPSVMGHVQAGRLRLVGLTSAKRSTLLPDERTLAEQGIEGVEVNSWVGLFAPASTPAAIVQRLIGEIGKAMRSEELRKGILAQGAEPDALSGPDFGADLRVESQRWAAVIKASGATID